MPIISTPYETLESSTYVDLEAIFDRRLYLKCEGFNFVGSVKVRTAAAMVSGAERDDLLRHDSVLRSSPTSTCCSSARARAGR